MSYVIDKKVFYSKLKVLSLPIAFQSLMLSAVAAADALMLGRIAQEEMTAVSLATQIQFVQNMFILAVTAAGSILGAQYYGKNDLPTVRRLFSMILRTCGLISFVFFVSCELIPGYLMHIFTQDEALVTIGSAYLRIAGWSYLINGVSQCYLAMFKITERVKLTAVISSVAVIGNVLLNSLFIFGLLGLPAMNARGAALATTLARAIELTLCLVYSFKKDYIRPDIAGLFKREHLLGKDFLKQCLPLLGGSLLWGVGFTAYTAIIGNIGSDAAAANSVSAVVRDIICCACNGIGTAAGIMVGNELGAGKLEVGKAYGLKLIRISWVVGFASTAIVLALTPLVVHMVKLTDEAQAYLTGMMIIMAVYMIGRCVNTITINGVLDGGGDTIFDMYSLAVTMWGLAIPLALLGAFVFHWHVFLVFACTCLDEVGKIPWVMVRVKKYRWVQDLTRERI